MKFTEPIGNAAFAPLFIRLSLGAYFVMAGLAKSKDVPSFIAEVQQFGFIHEHLATIIGIALPYIEIGAGGMLIMGMWTTLASLVLCIMLSAFVYAFGIFPRADLFNTDIILLAAAISVLFSGSGALSVDKFRKDG